MKRKLATGLVVILSTATVLSGCGSSSSSDTASEETEETAEEETAEETEETEGAAEEADEAGEETTAESADTSDRIQITYSTRGSADELSVYQQAVDAFNEAQDEIFVTMEAYPSDSYNENLITQLAGGTAADVVYVEDTIIQQLIDNGTILDLTDFLETDASYVSADEYDAGCWGAAKNEDGIFGLSVDCNPVLLYYSPSMFEELGIEDPQELFENGEWTWDKFDEICDILVENGKYGLIQSGDNIRLYNWVFANYGTVWQDDTTYRFDDAAVEALQYVSDRLQDGRFIYGGTLPDGQGDDAMFMSGQVGFIALGRWYTKTFYDADIDFDYIPYPTIDGTQYLPAQVCLGYNSVNASSENAEAAMTFVSYYCGELGQAARIEGVGTSVPSVTGLDDLILDSAVPEHAEHILEVRATGWASGDELIRDNIYNGFSDATKSVFEEIYVNGADVEETLEKVYEEADAIIADQ